MREFSNVQDVIDFLDGDKLKFEDYYKGIASFSIVKDGYKIDAGRGESSYDAAYEISFSSEEALEKLSDDFGYNFTSLYVYDPDKNLIFKHEEVSW